MGLDKEDVIVQGLKSAECVKVRQWNLPIMDIPNSGHVMNSGQNV